jgi:dynein heavy chain
MNYKNSL